MKPFFRKYILTQKVANGSQKHKLPFFDIMRE